MNRSKKEELRKEKEAIRGLSEEEILERNRKKEEEDRVQALARKIHYKLFPEEYDHMLDSYADSNMRRTGKNPMSQEYARKVNARRIELGVPPLTESGDCPPDNNSNKIALQMARDWAEATSDE